MKLSDEYRLSQYKDLGMLADNQDVHLVRNEMTGEICVRKKAPAGQAGIYRYLMEANAAGIPHIYECITQDDGLIVVEEYVSGRTIEEIVSSDGVIRPEKALDITAQLCDILEPLHAADNPVICRDLKAANIMLTEDGRARIVDFDIARVYRPGLNKDTCLLGTQGYAAPEQFGFGQTDARTDIYALGVLLNYMITGRMISDGIAQGEAAAIIGKCTRLKPDERYDDVVQLKNDIINKNNKMKPGRRKYLPPGFRTMKPWKMIIAAAGYAAVTAVCSTVVYNTPNGPAPMREQISGRISLWISQIIMILIISDYCGIRNKIPVVRNRHRAVRIIGYIILEIVLVVAAAAVSALIDFFTG